MFTDVAYEVDERPDGFWTRYEMPGAKWIGPYPTREAADAAIIKALEGVAADLATVMLGLKLE